MSFLTKLPFELHIPGYQYCGPSTKLEKRLARGDPGRNPLDRACKEHDIAYSKSEVLSDRHAADRVLADKAWERVKAKDASVGEKISALGVAGAMKTKVKLGFGLNREASGSRVSKKPSFKQRKSKRNIPFGVKPKKKSVHLRSKKKTMPFSKLVQAVKGNNNITEALKSANFIKKGHTVKVPPVIDVKSGGILPLIPIFAALSAIGSLAGGAAGVATAVNRASAAKNQLEEQKRHNKTIEEKKIGKGLYLKPYKKGYGLYLRPFQKN